MIFVVNVRRDDRPMFCRKITLKNKHFKDFKDECLFQTLWKHRVYLLGVNIELSSPSGDTSFVNMEKSMFVETMHLFLLRRYSWHMSVKWAFGGVGDPPTPTRDYREI